jgi:hypothetical protein
MAGPEQQAANQLQVKRSAESEAQPAPVAKRPVTQEFEEKKDVQDGATVEPLAETNHVVSCWSLLQCFFVSISFFLSSCSFLRLCNLGSVPCGSEDFVEV